MSACQNALLLVLVFATSCRAQRFQRLTWPSENAEMKIVPHVEVPVTYVLALSDTLVE